MRLFQRTTRSQRLTDNGALFYERCLRALEEIRSAESLLETGKHQINGRLRVAMPVLFGRQCVAPLLIELAQEHPGLSLKCRSATAWWIWSRKASIWRYVTARCRTAACWWPESWENTAWSCAPRPTICKRGHPDAVDDLSRHSAINYLRAGRVLSLQLMDSDGTPRTFMPRSSLNMDDLQAICDAAVTGHGIAGSPAGWPSKKFIRESLSRSLSRRRMSILTSTPSGNRRRTCP